MRERFRHGVRLGVRAAGRTWERVVRFFGARALLLVLFVTGSVLTLDWRPATLSLKPGDISPEDFVAPRTLVYVDEQLTERLREEAAARVPDVYDPDLAAPVRAETRLRDFLERLSRWVEVDAQRARLESLARIQDSAGSDRQAAPEPAPGSGAWEGAPGEADSGSAADGTSPLLPSLSVLPPLPALPEGMTPELARKLAEAGLLRPDVQEFAVGLLRQVMQQEIRPDQLGAVRRQLMDTVAREIDGGALLAPLIADFVEPTRLPNPAETEARRAAARAAVQPVQETIKQGQVIARKGSVLTPEQITRLQVLGLLEPPVENRLVRIGLSQLLALIFGVAWLQLMEHAPLREQAHGLTLAWLGIAGITVVEQLGLPVPAAVPLMLAAAVWGSHAARLMGAFLLGVVLLTVGSAQPEPAAVLLASALLVPIWLHPHRLTRTAVVLAGIIPALAACAGLLVSDPLPDAPRAAAVVLVHLLSGVLTLGLLPLCEWLTGYTSTLRLLELSDLSHPLLQRLFVEAPGTWQHSLAVGSLAEMAAQVVGANPILARVGGYYHDVGKLVAGADWARGALPPAAFFTENQAVMLGSGAPSPHEHLTPEESAELIRRHTECGAALLAAARFPPAIINIARTHHGTSRIEYFYRKALRQAEAQGKEAPAVDEQRFRYPGPLPRTREEAIVMIADTVEAFSRSVPAAEREALGERIRGLIHAKFADGQFDACGLTTRDIALITDVLTRAVQGAVHERIAYPGKAPGGAADRGAPARGSR